MVDVVERVAIGLHDIVTSNLDELPTGRDLARLARKFQVLQLDGDDSEPQVRYANHSQESLLGTLRRLLNTIALITTEPQADADLIMQSEEELGKQILLDEHQSITNFLVAKYGNNGRVTQVLKLCNQAVILSAIGPAAIRLAKENIRWKDVRGSWSVVVKRTQHSVSVSHRRTEQAYRSVNNISLKNTFQFTWEVEAQFSDLSAQHLSAVSIRIFSVTFNNDEELQMTPEEIRHEETRFRKHFPENCTVHIRDDQDWARLEQRVNEQRALEKSNESRQKEAEDMVRLARESASSGQKHKKKRSWIPSSLSEDDSMMSQPSPQN